MSATTASKKPDPAEERAAKVKSDRENAVRRYCRDHYQSKADKITVANVFGDSYRVNFYVRQAGKGDIDALKTYSIVQSEFITMKVELAPEVPMAVEVE